MRNIWIMAGLSAALILTSCEQRGFDKTDDIYKPTVKVAFEAAVPNRYDYSPGIEKIRPLEVILKKSDLESGVEMLSEDPEGWKQTDSSWDFIKNLQVGSYYFWFFAGLDRVSDHVIGNSGNICYVVETSGLASEKNYKIVHPSLENSLKVCGSELYMDNSVSDASELVHLNTNEKFNTKRTLTHAQGRVDLLFVNALKTDTGYVPVSEGTVIEQNPLFDVSSISVFLQNVNSTCVIFDQTYENPMNFETTVEGGHVPEFDFETYKNSFLDDQNLDWLSDCNSANSRIWTSLFFPSENITGKVTLTYQNGRKIEKELSTFEIQRNRASLITVWMTTEKESIDVDIDETPPEFKEESIGDNGFWN